MWISYLIKRFVFRIQNFFQHWYVGGFRVVSHSAISTLEQLDRTIAFKITLRHWFTPLYRDYTIVGYVLGFFFRSSRLFIGGILYGAIIVLAVAIYVAWALVIPGVLYWGFFV